MNFNFKFFFLPLNKNISILLVFMNHKMDIEDTLDIQKKKNYTDLFLLIMRINKRKKRVGDVEIYLRAAESRRASMV